jgi:hypothetical protein
VLISEKAKKWLPTTKTQQRLSQWLYKLFKKNREGEIDHNEASKNKYLITSKDSRRNKGKTSQSPSPTKSPFFCCEKSYPTDKLSSPLDQDPYLWSKDRSEQVVSTFPIYLTQSIKQERRRMWRTLLRCSSSLLQSLGLISKILNANEVLQRLTKGTLPPTLYD